MCELSTFEQAVHLTLNAISLHKAISRFFAYCGTGIGPDDFIAAMKKMNINMSCKAFLPHVGKANSLK